MFWVLLETFLFQYRAGGFDSRGYEICHFRTSSSQDTDPVQKHTVPKYARRYYCHHQSHYSDTREPRIRKRNDSRTIDW